jgi:hypothetical protein
MQKSLLPQILVKPEADTDPVHDDQVRFVQLIVHDNGFTYVRDFCTDAHHIDEEDDVTKIPNLCNPPLCANCVVPFGGGRNVPAMDFEVELSTAEQFQVSGAEQYQASVADGG